MSHHPEDEKAADDYARCQSKDDLIAGRRGTVIDPVRRAGYIACANDLRPEITKRDELLKQAVPFLELVRDHTGDGIGVLVKDACRSILDGIAALDGKPEDEHDMVESCCANENRTIEGGCATCGDPSL